MPQEVRQLPQTDMILLVEGQKPVRARKVRFFDMEPFKGAAAYGTAHRPDVPHVEIDNPQPVPATAPGYGKGGDEPTSADLVDAKAAVPPAVSAAAAVIVTDAVAPAPKPSVPKRKKEPKALPPSPLDGLKLPGPGRKKPVSTVRAKDGIAAVTKRAAAEFLTPAVLATDEAGVKIGALADVTMERIAKPRRKPILDLLAAAESGG